MSQNHYPEVSKIDMLICLLQKTGTSETQTSVHATSVRLPTFDYANVEALAQHSGCSRNKIFCELISLALSEVWSGLDDENSSVINDLRNKIHHEMIGSSTGANGEWLHNLGKLPQSEKGEC